VRALRVLLACALLALSAGRSGPARVWTDTAVLIAAASSAPPPDVPCSEAHRAAPKASERPDAPAAFAPLAPATEPENTTRNLVLVSDRYLRNRALLC
jgi:hypothetical protein